MFFLITNKNNISLDIRHVIIKYLIEGKMQLSIGFRCLEAEYKNINRKKIRILKKIELNEVSVIKTLSSQTQ